MSRVPSTTRGRPEGVLLTDSRTFHVSPRLQPVGGRSPSPSVPEFRRRRRPRHLTNAGLQGSDCTGRASIREWRKPISMCFVSSAALSPPKGLAGDFRVRMENLKYDNLSLTPTLHHHLHASLLKWRWRVPRFSRVILPTPTLLSILCRGWESSAELDTSSMLKSAKAKEESREKKKGGGEMPDALSADCSSSCRNIIVVIVGFAINR